MLLGRPSHYRFGEHIRAGNNPAWYQSNGIAKHYAKFHPNEKHCRLTFTFLDRQSDSVRRKISEAIRIHTDKPSFNNKDEMVDAMKFIIR